MPIDSASFQGSANGESAASGVNPNSPKRKLTLVGCVLNGLRLFFGFLASGMLIGLAGHFAGYWDWLGLTRPQRLVLRLVGSETSLRRGRPATVEARVEPANAGVSLGRLTWRAVRDGELVPVLSQERVVSVTLSSISLDTQVLGEFQWPGLLPMSCVSMLPTSTLNLHVPEKDMRVYMGKLKSLPIGEGASAIMHDSSVSKGMTIRARCGSPAEIEGDLVQWITVSSSAFAASENQWIENVSIDIPCTGLFEHSTAIRFDLSIKGNQQEMRIGDQAFTVNFTRAANCSDVSISSCWTPSPHPHTWLQSPKDPHVGERNGLRLTWLYLQPETLEVR